MLTWYYFQIQTLKTNFLRNILYFCIFFYSCPLQSAVFENAYFYFLVFYLQLQFSPTKCIFNPTKCIFSLTFCIFSLTFLVWQNAIYSTKYIFNHCMFSPNKSDFVGQIDKMIEIVVSIVRKKEIWSNTTFEYLRFETIVCKKIAVKSKFIFWNKSRHWKKLNKLFCNF
jgi:hypothetical protein